MTDLDIGIPTKQNLARPTEVQNFEKVIASIKSAVDRLDEAIGELRKITLGTGLVTGVDLDEEVE